MNIKEQNQQTNYEIAKKRTAEIFIGYDLPAMIQKTGFESDDTYIYVDFLSKRFLVNRTNGLVSYIDPVSGKEKEAEYSSAMTLYDIICYSKEDCRAAEEYIVMQNLAPMYNASSYAGANMFKPYCDLFDQNREAFEQACIKLKGKPFGKGDVSYTIPVFHYNGEFCVSLDFWYSDEEFPAQLTILCDQNLLQYMHYETMWFMIGYIMNEIKLIMSQIMKDTGAKNL